MMGTRIFCEGTTDLLLLQFILQYQYGWIYKDFEEEPSSGRLLKRRLFRGNEILEIISCGGIDNIPKEMKKMEDLIENATRKEEVWSHLIVMIDQDTLKTKEEFIKKINAQLKADCSLLRMNQWNCWEIENAVLGKQRLHCYIKCIPEEESGAIETVMLEALDTDEIEHDLIRQSIDFIEDISRRQSRYLQKKSRISKAVFNSYFSIRAPEEKYDERAKILKAYQWKENRILEEEFSFLQDIGSFGM